MLDAILKYQEIEANILAIENEFLKSKERNQAADMKKVLNAGHARLLELEKLAGTINEKYKKASDKYAKFNEKLDSLEKELETADAQKFPIYEKAYKDFSAIAASLEKEISVIYEEINKISSEYESIMKKSKTDREKFDKYKAVYDKYKAEKDAQIEKLNEELKNAKKNVNEKLMKLYLQKREGKLFQVFVPISAKKCVGCRMEVSASKIGEMKTNEFGIIECEHCGRYIYNK